MTNCCRSAFATRARIRTAVAWALSLSPVAAGAQAVSVAGPTLEEVVVSAEKRTERSQDVPIPLIAVDAAELERQGTRDLRDIAQIVPGVSFTNSEPTRSVLVIRGISPVGGQPTVGLYLDDVPITGQIGTYSGSPEPAVLDMERVEVLKGPQGTLYGAGSMGGAIKLVTARPDVNAFGGFAEGDLGTTHEGAESYGAKGMLNLPLVHEKLALRLAASYQKDGGFIDRVQGADWGDLFFRTDPQTLALVTAPSGNTVAQADINDRTVRAARVSLLFQPDPTFTIRPTFDYQDGKYGDFGYRWGNLPGFEQSQVYDQPASSYLRLARLDIEKQFQGATLTSLTGYLEDGQTLDADYTFYVRSLVRGSPAEALFDNLGTFWQQRNDGQTWTEELRLQSNGEGRLRWLTGLYYSDAKRQNVTRATSPGISALVPPFLQPLVVDDVVFGVGPTERTLREYAAFGEATYRMTSALDLTLGLRWFKFSSSTVRPAFGLFNGGTTEDSAESTEHGLNPKVTLSYHVSADNLLYATASKGFRPGGPNTAVPLSECAASLAALGRTSAPDSYDSDSLWNYEIGSKNTLGDGRWIVNGTVFYIDWSGIQQSVDLACGFPFIDNVGDARSRGVELEIQGRPVRALTLSLGAVYTDAQITKTVPGVTAQVGDELLGTPKWIVNGSAEYLQPLTAAISGYVRLDYQWRGAQRQSFTDSMTVGLETGGTAVIPDPASFQQGYGLTNLSVGLTSRRWEARAYVDNVFDKVAVVDPSSDLRIPQQAVVYPRRIGVVVRVSF